MKLYVLQRTQRLRLDLPQAWDFFCDPANLARITPPELNLVITPRGSTVPHMYPGQILTYRVGIAPLIKVNWVTEITHVSAPHFFVDEQRFGPYRFWHHQHHLREIAGGVEVEDLIHYAIGFSLLGSLAHRVFIRRQLEGIFEYRRRVLAERFGEV